MTRFYLLRHGQTLFNQKKLIQGFCDSPLTKLGIEQAVRVQASIESIHFDAVYSSMSERAYDTACIATKDKYPIHRSKKLKEVNFGTLEGEKEDVFKNKDINSFFDLASEGWQDVGGENSKDVVIRIKSYLENIANIYPDGDILIVTHGGVIMLMAEELSAEYVYNLSREKKALVPNCSITVIHYDNEFILEKFAVESLI